MKVLVLGCYYSANLGDGVICESAADQIRQVIPEAEIVIEDLWDRSSFKNRNGFAPDFAISKGKLRLARFRAGLYRFVTRRLRWDVQYISMRNRLVENQAQLDRICSTDCDLVVFAGGQMFMDAYALRLWYIIRKFEAKGVPVILNACGMGPTYSEKLKSRLREAINAPNVTSVSCRDDVQKANEYYAAADKRVEETFDPALGCADCYKIEKETDSQVVGLGVMWNGRIPPKTALHFWHGLILELEKKGTPWKLFVNGETADISFARLVLETLPGGGRALEEYFVPVPSKPEELVKTISQFKSIVSFRLHSHIIAASLNIPSVSVVWDDKVRIFFEKIGHPERCCNLRCGAEEVLSKLDKAEKEGIDGVLVAEQKRFSAEWLTCAVKSSGAI